MLKINGMTARVVIKPIHEGYIGHFGEVQPCRQNLTALDIAKRLPLLRLLATEAPCVAEVVKADDHAVIIEDSRRPSAERWQTIGAFWGFVADAKER